MRAATIACIVSAAALLIGGCAAPLEPLNLVEPSFSFAADGDGRDASAPQGLDQPIASVPTR